MMLQRGVRQVPRQGVQRLLGSRFLEVFAAGNAWEIRVDISLCPSLSL